MIYVSSGAFQTRSLAEILAICEQYKFFLELGPSVEPVADAEAMLAQVKNTRMLVHNYFPPPAEPFVLNLASTDTAILRKSLAHCRRAIDLCAVIGAPFYSVYAGFAMHLSPQDLGNPEAQKKLVAQRKIPRATAYACFLESVKNLAQYARERNVGLLVENNVSARENLDKHRESPLLLSFPGEIEEFFQDVTGSGVRLLFDTGHAKVAACAIGERPESFLEKLLPYIEALHLSENDGLRDTNKSFDSGAWFVPYLAALRDKKMVIEVYRLTIEQIQVQHKLLKEMID